MPMKFLSLPARRPARASKADTEKLRWGLHHLGHFAARAPWAALAIVLAMSALAGFGVTRIQTNSSLDALFQSDTPEYRRYQQTREAFPLNERDVLIVVTSPKPFEPADIEALRELHLELQLLDPAEGVLSLFSLRGSPTGTDYAPPLIPDVLPEGGAFTALMSSVAAHPFAADKLVGATATGGQALVMLVSLTAEAANRANLPATIDAVAGAATDMLAGTGLEARLLGAPVMQHELRLASGSDRLTFNLAGFLIGLLMCFAFFRRVKFVAISALCPAIAILWSFGIVGLFGFPLSFFMNSIPPLVMVIAFADATHLTYGIRQRLREGDGVAEAVRRTLETVAPASLLALLITAVAFASLLVSNSNVIRDFALAGAIAVTSIFFVNMLTVPSLARLLLRGDEGRGDRRPAGWIADLGVDRACASLARWVPRHSRLLTAVAIVICLICTAMYLALEPRFRLSEQVPDRMRDRIAATEKVAGFVGTSPVYVVIRYPDGEVATSDRLRQIVGQVHDTLAEQESVGSVWSLALIEREFADATGQNLADSLEDLPSHLRARLMNPKARTLLVTGHLPDLDTPDMRAAIAAIETDLEPLRTANPDLSVEITGISAVSALHTSSMIGDLNRSLMLAVFVVMVVLGVAFRSLSVPLIAFLPNVLPDAASGALLYLFGFGIDYAAMVALTVAFGLAVDDTVHFLARYHQERNEGSDISEAVRATIRHVGPVMVITTVVLICGVGVTLFGQMPQTRTFGAIVIVTLISALIADLLFTPALILAFKNVRRIGRSR